MSIDLNRRDLIKILSLASLGAPLALAAPEPGAPLFFTKDEFALLDTLAELIIPTDDHSPGAHAAGVAAYLDRSVAEAFLPEDKTNWRKGLASVDALSESMHDKPFLKTSKSQQIAVLEKMSAKEKHGPHQEGAEQNETEPEKFFGQLKESTVFAYYTSSIGIHQEINYKGNVLLDQFVGYMPDAELPPISTLTSA